eukprot:TRINITY_DN2068_c0_g1_i2.p1 TRINITY_DN2068_c0_g1~~TRINITY_DN2068_c0_g1_i2.p1  ORF type:complete len:950 (+),score=302.99 TRINITY_DN2068_c0_g1_i2:181-3030(+)
MQRLVAVGRSAAVSRIGSRTATAGWKRYNSFTANTLSSNVYRASGANLSRTVLFQSGNTELKDLKRASSTIPSTDDAAYNVSELENRQQNANLLRLITAYRRYGHVIADLDPLKLEKKDIPPELDLSRYGLDKIPSDKEFPLPGLIHIEGKKKAKLSEILDHLKQVYCGKVAGEFLYIQNVQQRRWFSDKLEALPKTQLSSEDKLRIFSLVSEAEAFDHFMQRKFPFVKRYALEGNESMIPAIDAILSTGSSMGIKDVVIAMPHRGRLNLLVSLLKYPARDFFWKVKGNTEFPEGIQGTGDVISHIGQSVDLEYGSPVHVSLIQNPSHLEAVDSVGLGKVKAKQDIEKDKTGNNSMCLMLHGDASFYGQGTVAETLGISKLPEFTTGGAVHIIVNNQLGFTTAPTHGRSSRYSADIGKIIDVPTIHVNSDSPEDVVKACRLAVEYRQLFKSDIIVDLIGYRRHGHNELDEPSFTQPIMYKAIRARPSVVKLYGAKLEDEGLLSSSEQTSIAANFDQQLASELTNAKRRTTTDQHLLGKWSSFVQASDVTKPVDTGVDVNKLKEIGLKTVNVGDVQIHQRLNRFVKARVDEINKDSIDWPTAEAMSFGSLLTEGYSIRLCGQDSGRGTFSQRHAVLVDQETEKRIVPLQHLQSNQGSFQVVNSPLSELAVLGFEYGYSIEDPKTLPIWEAQFGDFANGAQIMIDTFISCGEAKWLKQSGLVMLLPHGYDGTGPEHSSGRVERFLQMCDGNSVDINDRVNVNTNMYVVNPTTPANYFHLLRRQMLTNYRKPLIVMAPKILIRHDKAVSKVADMGPGTHFLPVIGDNNANPEKVERVMICSGKVYYSLVDERQKRGYDNDTAVIRLEELAPFPFAELAKELGKYRNAKNFVWCQDESQNAGAWNYVEPRLNRLVNKKVDYVGRPPCPAVSTGIGTVHTQETNDFINAAFPKK